MDEERAAKEEVKVVLAGLNRTIAAALRGPGLDSRLDSIVADLVDVARIGMPKILAGATMLDGSMITETSTRPMHEHHGRREVRAPQHSLQATTSLSTFHRLSE